MTGTAATTTDRRLRRGAGALLSVLLWMLAGCSPPEPATEGQKAQMRRLTEAQYRNSIADIFGADVIVAGRFEPLIRPDQGLLAQGTALAAISPAGFEQYESMARSIAAQVVDEQHRSYLIPCEPANADAPDDDCAGEFYRRVGRLILRRPLTDEEIATQVGIARAEAERLDGFYAGLAAGLAAMLVSPEFLFRIETAEPDPDAPGKYRLDAYSLAARLSFLLWNSTPDDILLTAAERGELHTARGLRRQVERLLDSARILEGARALFADVLEFEKLEDMSKDPMLYPKFNGEVLRDAREQMLRTVSRIIQEDADYRTLFTTRTTSLTRSLGMIYRIPVQAQTGWEKYEFPQDSGRAGLLTQIGFLLAHSHAGRSSPTLRGMAVREVLLCQKVPDPPGNVDFTSLEEEGSSQLLTARERLAVHGTEPSCAGCHKIMDPIGLALENFDAVGEYRRMEGGKVIDASGELDGMAFEDAVGLGEAVARNPATTRCLVNKAFQYAYGRPPALTEREYLRYLNERFSEDGYTVRALLRHIATSKAFQRVAAPEEAASLLSDGADRDPRERTGS